MSKKVKVGIIGPGNIGTDLMYKVLRSEYLEMGMMIGIDNSPGIKRAKDMGIPTSTKGVSVLEEPSDIKICFDATSAAAHVKYNAPVLKKSGIVSIDLTPAALGPYCVPSVNLNQLKREIDINMVTCGGQATIPIVYAISKIAGVNYAEIVACISSKSAGPGTRANMDEFTETTAAGIQQVGKADKGKAIIVLNPAEPPLMMTNTIIVKIKDVNTDFMKIKTAIDEMVTELKTYVPGYQLRMPPIKEGDRITTIIQVEGQGDFLPKYSGNLDIINAAAVQTAEQLAKEILTEKEN